MSKTSRNLRAFSWGKFSWTEMICVKKIDIMQLWLHHAMLMLMRMIMLLMMTLRIGWDASHGFAGTLRGSGDCPPQSCS